MEQPEHSSYLQRSTTSGRTTLLNKVVWVCGSKRHFYPTSIQQPTKVGRKSKPDELQCSIFGAGMDIFVIYHHTGNSARAKQLRSSTRATLASQINPRSEVLSILMGAFNYVAHRRDRFSKPDGNALDSHEATEESHFCRVLGDPFGFCELHQEEFTHDSALGRSRLDRVYSNHYLTDQLDRRIGCAALSWVPWLSAHRPVAFFRRRPSAAITTTSHFRQRL